MKRATLLLASLFIALTLAACSKSEDSQSSKPSDNQMARADKGVTASDQPENEADRKIIQEVRQALTADSSLSTSAQNVTVVSNNGKVTLRGSVKDDAEKQKIANKATQVAGVTNVDNQLTVTQ
jgi:hyperosmotically inducible periplasmic protein